MKYFILVRGPAGVGKSTISKNLVKKLKAHYISFDKVLSDNKIDIVEGDCIQLYNFIKADDIVIPEVLDKITTDVIVLDGCFYHLEQIEDLIKRIPSESFVFNLKANLDECIARDNKRTGIDGMGDQRVKDVYKLVSKFDYGTNIETGGRSVEEITEDILSRLPREQ